MKKLEAKDKKVIWIKKGAIIAVGINSKRKKVF